MEMVFLQLPSGNLLAHSEEDPKPSCVLQDPTWSRHPHPYFTNSLTSFPPLPSPLPCPHVPVTLVFLLFSTMASYSCPRAFALAVSLANKCFHRYQHGQITHSSEISIHISLQNGLPIFSKIIQFPPPPFFSAISTASIFFLMTNNYSMQYIHSYVYFAFIFCPSPPTILKSMKARHFYHSVI